MRASNALRMSAEDVEHFIRPDPEAEPVVVKKKKRGPSSKAL